MNSDGAVHFYAESGTEIFPTAHQISYGSRLTGTVFVSPDFRYTVQALDNINLALTDREDAQSRVLQGNTCSVSPYASDVVAFSDDSRLVVSSDTCGEIHFWDAASGVPLTPSEAANYIPYGIGLGSDRIFVSESGEVFRWHAALFDGIPYLYYGNHLPLTRLSPDGTTLALDLDSRVALFGIPSAARPAFRSVLGKIVPQSVNVRSAPSLNANVIDTAPAGLVVIAGRDSDSRFVYLPAYAGWVNAATAYVQIVGAAVKDLPIRP